MPQINTAPTFYAVTTSGVSATRWLAYVLASNPQTYIAHGKHCLDAVIRGDFHQEKESADLDSLVRGNDMWDFYHTHSLEEVLARYQETKPEARAFGSVHSYTLDSLIRSAQKPQTLANIRILNLIRHPVNYIASHYALVRSSEKHPRLYWQYVEQVFPQVLQEFPELYLMPCPDYRAFLAFSASCFGVANQIRDMSYPGFRTLKMEDLTTEVNVLKDACEELTGLDYPRETLERYIARGAINQHRRSHKGSNDPHQVFASWEAWQQVMAKVMIPGTVLDWLEELSYDVSMLRVKTRSSRMENTRPDEKTAPCLADYLRMADQQHPLLAYLNQEKPSEIQFIDMEQRGFAIFHYQKTVYALARALGSLEPRMLTPALLMELESKGLCVHRNSMEEVWGAISRALRHGSSTSRVHIKSTPILVNTLKGYNIVEFNGWFYGLPQSLGPIDLEQTHVLEIPGVIGCRSRIAVEKEVQRAVHTRRSRRHISLRNLASSSGSLGNQMKTLGSLIARKLHKFAFGKEKD